MRASPRTSFPTAVPYPPCPHRIVVSSSRAGMSDDTVPHERIDPLEAKVVGFRQQPDARSFAELRQDLRRAGRGELLADVCATWGQHGRDPARAADAWARAG